MPFLFHSQKKSIFHKQNQRAESPKTKLKNLQIISKLMKDPNQFKVSVNLNKEYPFRTFNQEPNEKLESNQQHLELLNKKKEILKKYYEEKWKRIDKDTDIMRNQVQDLNIRQAELFVFPSGNISDRKRVENFQAIHETKNLQRQICAKHPFRNHYKKYIKTAKEQPGPTSYNPNFTSKEKVKNVVIKTSSTKSIKKSIQSMQSVPVEQTISEIVKFAQSYKLQQTANFKPTSQFKQKNMKLKNLLAGETKRKENKPEKQIQLQEDEIQQVSNTLPGPCNYSVSFKQDKITQNKSPFLQNSPRFQRVSPSKIGPGSYKNDNSSHTLMNSQVPFMSAVQRKVDFGNRELGSQQFWYNPKTQMIDQITKHYNPSLKQNFGTSLERFAPQDLQQWLIPQKDPTEVLINRKSPILNTKQKRILFHHLIKHSNSVSPGQYHDDTKTLAFNLQKIKQSQKKRNDYQSKIQRMSKQYHSMKPSEQIQIERLLKIKDKKTIHGNENIKTFKNGPQVSFGQKRQSPNNRGFLINSPSDAIYDLAKQYAWEQKSFNVNYGFLNEK